MWTFGHIPYPPKINPDPEQKCTPKTKEGTLIGRFTKLLTANIALPNIYTLQHKE
ncbi:157_t:CDS:2 [Ambispora gerdemannii]|uniref:157_t:CDS:1 n=1 Tax=Ambispora gerdemannii TaxID=144530 RepID=A0A9N9D3Y0_9GLOM|nr:157_t:CDS:2 [Ambispora gerdemannii]